MKMVKKILLGLVATAAVIGFVGCKPIDTDNAETSGTKWDKTVKVDASEVTTGFKRAFEQLGTLEQAQQFDAEITFNCLDDNGNVIDAVYGLAFDLNFDKNEDDKDIKDSFNFVLIGINPSKNNNKGQYYVERYKGVSMDENNGVKTSDSLGNYISYTSTGKNGPWTTEYKSSYSDWQNATGLYTVDEEGNVKIQLSVKQTTKGTYTVKAGNTTVCTYTRSDKSTKKPEEFVNVKDGYAQGGIAMYTNAKPGQKIEFNCKIDKDTFVGKLMAEEIE